MLTAPERHQQDVEADKLREAIRRHRSAKRPSQRSVADDELYRALGIDPVPTVHHVPPSAYAQAEERYFDAPY
jgi:hypothetical protein